MYETQEKTLSIVICLILFVKLAKSKKLPVKMTQRDVNENYSFSVKKKNCVREIFL